MIPACERVASRQRPGTFSDDIDYFLDWLANQFVPAANSLEQSLQRIATTGTSTTSITVATGAIALTTQVGKAWATGAFVYICSSASVANLLYGQITAYNALTGVLSVNVLNAQGAGTYSNWDIGLAVPMSSSLVLANLQANYLRARQSGAYGYVDLLSGDATHSGYLGFYDPSGTGFGYIGYAAAGIIEMTAIAGAYYQFNTPPRCAVDAATGSSLVRKSQMDAADAAVTAALALGGYRGLSLSASGANASLSVSADALMVLSAAGDAKVLAPALTINTAASGANGLDTGALNSNTWYAVWVIWNGTTVAGLISLSATAPTMPAGYTHKARVGWIRTDGSGNKYPLAFIQRGRRVQYVVAPSTNMPSVPVLASGVQGDPASGTWVSISVSSFVPPTAARLVGAVANGASSAGTTMLHPNANGGSYASLTNPPFVSVSIGISSRTVMPFDMTLESTTVYYSANISDSRAYCYGWEDSL